MKPSILYLDDEVNNLSSFKAVFRRDYQVFTAQSADEAKEILKSNDIYVIISDQRMPDKTGVEFFEEIKHDYPNAPRMLLTGYADLESVINAINKGQVYRYITKPWDETELKMSIDNALEIHNTRNELQKKNEELQKAYTELEKFVYSASHDLKAPIASMQGIIEVAKMENGSGNKEEQMRLIEQSVKKLDVLVENIIDYYKSSRAEVIIGSVDFNALVEEILDGLRFYGPANEIEFKLLIDQPIPFHSDIDTIKIILSNLISNAIKYQKQEELHKTVTIQIKISAGQANINIEDNGIGIKEEHMGKVFDMFYRATYQNSGSGLGLYIVQDALKKLNGKIDVFSTLGEGTSFDVKIPDSYERQPQSSFNAN